MTSDGSPYPRLKRAVAAGNLAIIEATAAELGWVALRDALEALREQPGPRLTVH